MKFRKKPVVIEAMQWAGDNINELWDWAGADNLYGPVDNAPARLYVNANDAWLDLDLGEWVIKDKLGFYPCKDNAFKEVYESVNES